MVIIHMIVSTAYAYPFSSNCAKLIGAGRITLMLWLPLWRVTTCTAVSLFQQLLWLQGLAVNKYPAN